MTELAIQTHNGGVLLDAYERYFVGNPQNMSVTLLDNAGNDVVHTFGNRAKFTADVSATMSANMYTGVYINADTGDDTNDGTASHPIKTLARLMSIAIPMSLTYVYLKRGQTFNLDALHKLNGRSFKFRAFGDNTLPRPLIKSLTTSGNDGGRFVVDKGISIISTQGVDYETLTGGTLSTGGSIFQVLHGKLIFFASTSKINLKDGLFIYAYDSYGGLEFGMSGCIIDKQTATTAELVYGKGVVQFSHNATTVTGVLASVGDALLGVDAGLTNYKTNRSLS